MSVSLSTLRRAALCLFVSTVAAFLGACNLGGGSGGSGAAEVVMTALAITPNTATLPAGTTNQFSATASFSDGSTSDVTADVAWSSSDTDIATIDSAGLATAKVAGGPVTITATLAGKSDTAELTVTDAVLTRIGIAPVNAEIADGTSQQYTATAIFSDNSTQDITNNATWASSNRNVADISNASSAKGLAIGQSPGVVEISASFGGEVGATQLTVTDATLTGIQVSPKDSKLANGFERQFTALGFFSNGTSQDITDDVAWSSSDETLATVSNTSGVNGKVTAAASGTGSVTISASFSGKTGSAILSITSATLSSISVSPDTTSTHFDPDVRIAFVATGTFSDGSVLDITRQVAWSSDNKSVATVSNAAGNEGEASPVSTGTANITATRDSISDSGALTVTDAILESITITPPNASIPAGRSVQYAAEGTYSDNSTATITATVTWSSSNANVEISNDDTAPGLATAKAAAAGETSDISASLSGITSNTAVLSVSSKVLDSIAVESSPLGTTSTAAGNEVTYVAVGTYSDGSKEQISTDISWTLSEETPTVGGDDVADITKSAEGTGILATFNPGTVTVRATQGGISGDSEQLTVTDAVLTGVVLSPANPTIPLSEQQAFAATAQYTDGSTADVTKHASTVWSSSEETVATIDNGSQKGLATSKAPGNTTISANFEGEIGSTTLTVSPATLLSITVEAEHDKLPVTFELQFSATGTYSDGSTSDITDQVTWATFQGFAVICNVACSKGLTTGITPGAETVRATLDGITGSFSLAVTDASLTSIVITPADQSRPINSTISYIATGQFDDGSSLTITDQVTWASSDTNVATISNADDSKGVATTKLIGSTEISARHTESEPDVVGSTNLTVTLL